MIKWPRDNESRKLFEYDYNLILSGHQALYKNMGVQTNGVAFDILNDELTENGKALPQ